MRPVRTGGPEGGKRRLTPTAPRDRASEDHRTWKRHEQLSVAGHRRRRAGGPLWTDPDRLADEGQYRQRQDARDRRGDPGGRLGLSPAAVHHHRHGWRGDPRRRLFPDRRMGRHRLRHRRGPVGPGRFRRHADLGQGQRPHGTGRVGEPGQGSGPGLPLGCHHRHVRGGRRASGRGRLLRHPDGGPGLRVHQPRSHRRPRRARLRCLADLHLRPSGRRHLHQGCGRRWRHGGQG